MPDRKEVVIQDLKLVYEYIRKEVHDIASRKCRMMDKVNDAIALLKEQEPIPCGEKIKAGDVVLDFYPCGHCKKVIRKPWRYCPFCGKPVKWE